MLDCKRAKFGKQSNFSSMYLSVQSVNYSKIENSSCAGKAILVYRPYGGFPEDTSFGAISHEACKAGAEMVIFCCQKIPGKEDRAMRAKVEQGSPLEKQINIPIVSVNQESGEFLGCSSVSGNSGSGEILVRLSWFGDGQ